MPYGKGTKENIAIVCEIVIRSDKARKSVAKLLPVLFQYLRYSEKYGCEVVEISNEQIAREGFNGSSKQARRAMKAALSTGLLLIVEKGKSHSQTVYRFGDTSQYKSVPETSGTVQAVLGDSSSNLRGQFEPLFGDTSQYKSVPTTSTQYITQPQKGGCSENFKDCGKPTFEEWQAYLQSLGCEDTTGEYSKLEARNFTDINGEPIRYWQAYAQKLFGSTAKQANLPKQRITINCEACSQRVTAHLQEDESYKAVCPHCGHATRVGGTPSP